MKKLFTLFAACLFTLFCGAQNLVPNPSFEDTVECPDNLGQVYNTVDWTSARLSPDYFNTCSESGNFTSVSVPHNYWGYQPPSSGNAYAGFAGKYGTGDIREYLGTSLISTLEVGTKYFISFKVSLSFRYNGLLCAINNLGVLFSTQGFTENEPAPISNRSHVYATNVISDTTNWAVIKGSFISDSTYSFINIGNFFADSLTTYVQMQGNQCNAYYYIDDVCVSTDSIFCDNYTYTDIKKDKKQHVSVYPNPFTDFLIIQYESREVEEIQIFNSTGELVNTFYTNNLNQIYLTLKNLPNGLYSLCCYNDKIFVSRHTILKT
ncbi:MAG TPA: T9SS type A sorting domain-containing protein [Chitinophagales bacterium]|nr:T9SS type A sorting domain-containing protein [Chitinophagales bacterium]